MKATELGTLFADREQLVIFSLDELAVMADKLKMPVGEFLEEFGGITISLPDGEGEMGYAVNKIHAVQEDGEIVDVALVGGDPSKIVRFLEKDEQSFDDFLKAHRDYCIVGEGEFFNQEVYDEIREEWDNRE